MADSVWGHVVVPFATFGGMAWFMNGGPLLAGIVMMAGGVFLLWSWR